MRGAIPVLRSLLLFHLIAKMTTAAVTLVPTAVPTTMPTAVPTTMPTAVPTTMPTAVPTTVPTAVPTTVPTAVPTTVPTLEPTLMTAAVPTTMPTTAVPTTMPTAVPTTVPTAVPTTGSQYKYLYQKSWYYNSATCSGDPVSIIAIALNSCLEISFQTDGTTSTFYIKYSVEETENVIDLTTSFFSDSVCTSPDSSRVNALLRYDFDVIPDSVSIDGSNAFASNSLPKTCYSRGQGDGYTAFNISDSDLGYPTQTGKIKVYSAMSDSTCSSIRGYEYTAFEQCAGSGYSSINSVESWESSKISGYNSVTGSVTFSSYSGKNCSSTPTASSTENIPVSDYNAASCEEDCREASVNGLTYSKCRRVKSGVYIVSSTPSLTPTRSPTPAPTAKPSFAPTAEPTTGTTPTTTPSGESLPSALPTPQPSLAPSSRQRRQNCRRGGGLVALSERQPCGKNECRARGESSCWIEG